MSKKTEETGEAPEDNGANPEGRQGNAPEDSPTTDTNDKKAIALMYEEGTTPKVSAKGEGDLAEAIIAIAREHGVPLYENPELVKSLAQLELGDEIPEMLYRVIAEIIAFAYIIQEKSPQDTSANHSQTT